MLKIFVTGDNHIGKKYAKHPQAAVLISARINAFEKMVQTANAENCALFVITGDLFDNVKRIAKRDIQTIVDFLSAFDGTVIVLPGNHDYYGDEVKVWLDFKEAISDKDNIMLLTEYRPYPVAVNDERVVLYPAHCTSEHSRSGENNLDWIKNENIVSDDSYRIGIAHGSVEGETIDNDGTYFPMTRKELRSIPVDVWLIGHTHVPFPGDLSESLCAVAEPIFNPGTHVQTDVSCNTEGQCFILEINENKAVRAKKMTPGNLRFYRREIILSAGSMEETLARELADYADESVVDIILTGAVTAEEYAKRSSVMDNLLARFVEGSYSDYGLSKLITKELIESEFPETSFSAGLLSALLAEPKQAQLVYDMLKTLKEGK